MNDADTDRSAIGIIVLGPERWRARWQARHQLVVRLGRRFPTVWVDPAHDRVEIPARIRDGAPAWHPAEGAPQLFVYTPEAWLPRLHRPAWASRALDHLRLARARRNLLRRGARTIVLSVWHPRFASLVRSVRHDVLLYHVNDEYSYRSDAPPVRPGELQLLRGADASYFSSRALLERKGALARHAVFLPNGVDFDAFARPTPEPADLASLPRPRIGYAGFIKRQLDWGLVEALARLRPDLHLVFVGEESPQPGLAERLAPIRALPNVHFLGGKSSSELAAYPQHFDVCAMPYVVDGYTDFIYPLKLHEYLASGQPAIGTPIRALAEFAGHVAIAPDAAEWAAAIDVLLATGTNSPGARAERQALAHRHDWDTLAGRLAADIATLAAG